MIGIGMSLAHMRNRKPTKKCDRCGLRYQANKLECPHCHNLSEEELSQLKKKIARMHADYRVLGILFILVALAIVAFIIFYFTGVITDFLK